MSSLNAIDGLDKYLSMVYLHCRYYEWRFDMKTRVQKWGNSLALRIPKSFADEVGLQKETSVEVSLADGKIVVTRLTKPKLTLEQLLSKVTKDNLHHEVDTGSAVGNETW
jgi:antitoxin MazE